MHKIPITIADILIELTSPLSATELGIEPLFGPFIGAAENPLARLSLRWEESQNPPKPRGELIYDPGSTWKMYYDGSDYYASLTNYNEEQTVQNQSLLRANPAWDDLILTEPCIFRPSSGRAGRNLINIIRAGGLILRTAVLFTGGLVFHASCLDDNGKGIVFVGPSDIGKSTQLKLWSNAPGVIPMEDDRTVVRVNGSKATCYGTPWKSARLTPQNHAAPLAALIVLEQAPENEITRLSPAQAASLLTARAFLPYWDAALMRRAMTNLNAILASVPVYRLRNKPGKETIPLVRSVL